MKTRMVWLGILVLVFGMTVVGCGAGGLNGTWVFDYDYGRQEIKFSNGKFEVFQNGTLGEELAYTTSGNKLIVNDPEYDTDGQIFLYSVKGNTLTLTPENGDTITLTRKQTNNSKKSGGSKAALIGRWSLEPGQPTRGNIEDLELLKDGTAIVDGEGGTWKVESGRFYFLAAVGALAYDYGVSGAILTLTDDDGTTLTYRKK